MSQLARFQDGFARALIGIDPPPGAPPEVQKAARQLAFSVYRNTVLKGWIDALQANFPAVARLVGEEWFRSCAAIYARGAPPRSPMLALYGETFPQFLETFGPAQELPYLPAVARMDRLWVEAHAAADAPVLGPMAFALPTEELGAAVAVLHPSVRVARFEHSAPSIWLETRGFVAESGALAFEPTPGAVLVARPQGAVTARALGEAGRALLSACAEGRPLGEAAAAALAAEPEADFTALFAELVEAGVFAELRRPHPAHQGAEP